MTGSDFGEPIVAPANSYPQFVRCGGSYGARPHRPGFSGGGTRSGATAHRSSGSRSAPPSRCGPPARHPERVARLVLAAGTARADDRTRLAALDLWRVLLTSGDRNAFARFVVGSAFSPAFVNGMAPEDVAATVAQIAANIPGGAAAQAALIATVDTTADWPASPCRPW